MRPASCDPLGVGGTGAVLVTAAAVAVVPVVALTGALDGVAVGKGEGGCVGVGAFVARGVCVRVGGSVGVADGVDVRVADGVGVSEGPNVVVEIGAITGRARAQSPRTAASATIATPRIAHDATFRRT